RSRFGESLYRAFFEEVVRLCERAGLVRGDKLFLDASLVEANASWDSLASRVLYQQLPGPPGEFVTRLFAENPIPTEEVSEVPEAPDPAQGHLPLLQENAPLRPLRANERRVSRTDPDAAIVDRRGTGPMLAYKAHFGVDAAPARVITAVDLTRGDFAEAHTLPYLVETHERLTGARAREAVADRPMVAQKLAGSNVNVHYVGIVPPAVRARDSGLSSIPIGVPAHCAHPLM
ncbi:MAG: hypothetical protein ACE5IZ_02745, partial [Dehalococcoidia bacterium]